MDRIVLKKNRLDLEYKFESQKAIVCFTAMTITVIGLLAAMVLKDQILLGFIIAIIFFTYSFLLYLWIIKRLKKILKKIERLK